jgi:hypothetical protein
LMFCFLFSFSKKRQPPAERGGGHRLSNVSADDGIMKTTCLDQSLYTLCSRTWIVYSFFSYLYSFFPFSFAIKSSLNHKGTHTWTSTYNKRMPTLFFPNKYYRPRRYCWSLSRNYFSFYFFGNNLTNENQIQILWYKRDGITRGGTTSIKKQKIN